MSGEGESASEAHLSDVDAVDDRWASAADGPLPAEGSARFLATGRWLLRRMAGGGTSAAAAAAAEGFPHSAEAAVDAREGGSCGRPEC